MSALTQDITKDIRQAAWDDAAAAAVIGRHVHRPGAMLPILHDLQETFGYVDRQAIPMIAEALNLSRAEVFGVVTFYHDFREAPAGRHTVKLCRAEACQAVGGEALALHLKRRLGIGWHGTTPDGAITLEPVFCLGLCACGPAALIDGEPVSGLDPEAIDARIAEFRP